MNHEKVVVELELDDILPNRFQPRFKFHEQAITELAESIKEHGVIQPILVRRLGDKYEIIAGERRYKASLLAGKRTIPAIVTDLNDKDSAEVALIENVQRQDLTPIEEAVSYRKILDMGYLTQEQLAEKLGKTQSTISNKLRLLNLDDDVQEALLDEKISERHARSLLKIDSKQKQKDILARIISERLTVKKTDELINNILLGKEDEVEVKPIPNILMNNSVQVEEPAIQSSSAIEFINPTDQNVINSFNGQNTKDEELINFLNTDNKQVETPVVPIEEIEEIPNIDSLNMDDVNFSNNQDIKSVEPVQNIDIPTSPIIEEIEPTVEVASPVIDNAHEINEINNMINNIPTQINPGFVDVENIEKNAQDIYVEKPLADIDNLLRSNDANGMYENTTSNELKFNEQTGNFETEQPVQQNKFFTMFAPAEEPVEEDNKEISNDETFNFTPEVENAGTINQFLTPEPVQAEVKQEESNVQLNNEPINQFDNFNMNMNEFNNSQVENNQEILSNQNQESVIPEQNASNLNIDDFYETQDKLEEIDDSPKTLNYPEDNVLAESIRKEEIVKEMPKDNNIYAVADLKTVINTIRNCSDTIEKYGFALECEEYDFEDMYQVIFKIQKNDK